MNAELIEVEEAKLQKAYNKGFEDCRQATRDIYERLGLIRYDPSKADTSVADFKEIADIIYVDTDSIKIKKEESEES